jgi:hypothetical protein
LFIPSSLWESLRFGHEPAYRPYKNKNRCKESIIGNNRQEELINASIYSENCLALVLKKKYDTCLIVF